MKNKVYFIVLIAIAVTGTSSPQTGQVAEDGHALVGDWRGDSICVVKPSACNDEKALYHIKKLGDQSSRFSLQADKIVNGQAVEMGSMECSFAPAKHELMCSTPKLVLHLTLNGKSLDGTMNLADGTVWRNITLRRD
jgi:hypothetical protein